MTKDIILTLDEVESLSCQILEAAGTADNNARSVARSIKLAERDGLRSHGLLYLPIYANHVRCGKVNGHAHPTISRPRQAALHVDVNEGFAHPAIDMAMVEFTDLARQQGIAILTLHNSYNCGVLGHHAQNIASRGLVGLCMTHAPASIAPIGGKDKIIGTNPLAFAVPDGQGGVAFTIDQSASVVAKSEILLRAARNEPLEAGWALNNEGQATLDAQAALHGTMLPSGGYKGFNIGLMVEVLAACLAGGILSQNASSFADLTGGPPRTGQCFIAISPDMQENRQFFISLQELINSIRKQEGVHLPGDKKKSRQSRIECQGVHVPQELLDRIHKAVA